jgi:mRNA-decapping enzyme subunit 2
MSLESVVLTETKMNASIDDNNNHKADAGKVILSPTMHELIDDLVSRFFLNLPRDEIESELRCMHHMELAYWHFQDFFADRYSNLPKLNFKIFTQLVINRITTHNISEFKNCPLLKLLSFSSSDISSTGSANVKNANNIASAALCSRYRKYTCTIPVNGCILLSKDMKHCLVVRSWNKNIWNFPKGKKNKGESDEECAIREVWEEVGFDVSKLINKDLFVQDGGRELAIRASSKEGHEEEEKESRKTKLFIIPMVDKDNTIFKTHTKKEIRCIKWIPISDIPFRWQGNSKFNRPIWPLTRFERGMRDYIKSVSPPRQLRRHYSTCTYSLKKGTGTGVGTGTGTNNVSKDNLLSWRSVVKSQSIRC